MTTDTQHEFLSDLTALRLAFAETIAHSRAATERREMKPARRAAQNLERWDWNNGVPVEEEMGR